MTAPLGKPGSKERKDAVRKYFRRSPDSMDEVNARRLLLVAVAAAVVAASLLIVGLAVLAMVAVGVALVVALHGWTHLTEYRRRYGRAEPKPRDADMDQTLREDIAAAAARGMTRLELIENMLELRSADVDGRRLADQGSGPLTVFGPAKGSKGRSGTDRVWRFTSYDVMVVCPTEHHLAIFECVLDFATGGLRLEDTHEYHYRDVVAVLTMTRPTAELSIEQVDAGRYAVSFSKSLTREMQIVVSSGDRSAIAVKIEEPRSGELPLQESRIDQVIRAVRQLLREKKGGVAATPRQ